MKMHKTILTMLAATLAVIGTTATVVHADDPPDASPIAGDGGEVQVGSVVAQATLRDSKCIVATPISVGGRMPSGASPLEVVLELDETCRVLIKEIRRTGVTGEGTSGG